MADESYWVDRAQSAEAQLGTLRDNLDRVKADARTVMETLAARKKSDGTFSIDFEKLVERLGLEACMELRGLIDEHYQITGAPGEKPRVKLSSV